MGAAVSGGWEDPTEGRYVTDPPDGWGAEVKETGVLPAFTINVVVIRDFGWITVWQVTIPSSSGSGPATTLKSFYRGGRMVCRIYQRCAGILPYEASFSRLRIYDRIFDNTPLRNSPSHIARAPWHYGNNDMDTRLRGYDKGKMRV